MKLVLDTHALIWAFQGSVRLGRGAEARLRQTAPVDCVACDVSLSETARLVLTGKIVLQPTVTGADFVEALAAHALIHPVTPQIAWTAASMQWDHRDPCDRHILATAIVLGIPLVSADKTMTRVAAKMGVSVIW